MNARLGPAFLCALALTTGCGGDASKLEPAAQMCREALAERLDVAVDHSALGKLRERFEGTDGSVILTGSVPLLLVRHGGVGSSDGALSTVECRILEAYSEKPRLDEVAVGARLAGWTDYEYGD